MSRYAPILDLWSGSHNLTADCLDLTIDMALSQKSPSINFTLDNRKERWSSILELGLKYVPVTCAVNGVDFFKGRLDLTTKDISKRGGNILVCSGRGDFGALEDITSSLQFVNAYPHDIVNAIIAEYNLRADPTHSHDPAITIVRNDAPQQGGSNAIKMGFQWKRMSFQRMLYELQQALGAPYANGGVAKYYDVYLDTSDGFYFDETGAYASGITIPANSETMTAKRICDMNPYRSDIWLWCNATAGRIPLEMQTGYNTFHYQPPHTPDPRDPWTETNGSVPPDWAVDPDSWAVGVEATTALTYSWGNGAYNLALTPKVGGAFLIFTLSDSPSSAPAADNPYWSFSIPFGYSGDKSLWPGQLPKGKMNCYNEIPSSDPVGSAMNETMGEMTALSFWFAASSTYSQYWQGVTGIPIFIEVVDTDGYLSSSEPQTYYPYSYPTDSTAGWQLLTFPFGPSSGYSAHATQVLENGWASWDRISEVRFRMGPYGHHFGGIINPADNDSVVCFDGFCITKPLVVAATDPGPGLCKTDIRQYPNVAYYQQAAAIAFGLLQNENQPQIYWDFTNLGRIDIPVGRTFGVAGTPSLNLLMRELKLTMSKRRGFLITGKAYESV